MGTDQLPAFLRENHEIHEWKHACAILASDFPDEFRDIVETLAAFRFKRSWINVGGGGGCPILVFGIKKSLYVEDAE